jgi:hypothetical protein
MLWSKPDIRFKCSTRDGSTWSFTAFITRFSQKHFYRLGRGRAKSTASIMNCHQAIGLYTRKYMALFFDCKVLRLQPFLAVVCRGKTDRASPFATLYWRDIVSTSSFRLFMTWWQYYEPKRKWSICRILCSCRWRHRLHCMITSF